MVTLNALALVVALTGTGETVLLDFTSPTCGPCQTMEPTIRRLTRDGYPVRKIDVSQHPDIATRFQVTGVPCFVMLANGREVDRVVGACSHARLVEMFTAARPRSAISEPARPSPHASIDTVRAQSPEAQSSEAQSSEAQSPQSRPGTDLSAGRVTANPRRGAFEATVRLRIEDADGHSIGTGTIVDAHGREALAVTCGHIFRDSAGQGRVLVDLFPNGHSRTVEGTLISYDLTRDIGLVSFVPGFAVAPAKIAPAGHRFAAGDVVFSVGCDHGRDPSVRDSRITSIDRYLGPPNIEATGEPAQGRSGGGLFSQDGFLIGICNHGDPRDDEGIYASLPTIHWELDRVGQRRIYQPNAELLAVQGLSPSRVKPLQLAANAPATPRTITPVAAASATIDTIAGNDTEVICIVRSRSNPQAGDRVYVLEQPSPDLLDQLTREAGVATPTGQMAARQTRPITPRQNAVRATAPGDPVVRAQSADRR